MEWNKQKVNTVKYSILSGALAAGLVVGLSACTNSYDPGQRARRGGDDPAPAGLWLSTAAPLCRRNRLRPGLALDPQPPRPLRPLGARTLRAPLGAAPPKPSSRRKPGPTLQPPRKRISGSGLRR